MSSKRLRGADGVVGIALTGVLVAIGKARIDVMRLDQERAKLRPAIRVAAGREGSQGIAVIALTAGDDVAALGMSGLDEILPGHLERGLDGLRTARHEIDMGHALGRVRDETIRERFRDLRGEETRMREGELLGLRDDGRIHIGMAVSEARDGGAARGVDIGPSIASHDLDTFAADGDR